MPSTRIATPLPDASTPSCALASFSTGVRTRKNPRRVELNTCEVPFRRGCITPGRQQERRSYRHVGCTLLTWPPPEQLLSSRGRMSPILDIFFPRHVRAAPGVFLLDRGALRRTLRIPVHARRDAAARGVDGDDLITAFTSTAAVAGLESSRSRRNPKDQGLSSSEPIKPIRLSSVSVVPTPVPTYARDASETQMNATLTGPGHPTRLGVELFWRFRSAVVGLVVHQLHTASNNTGIHVHFYELRRHSSRSMTDRNWHMISHFLFSPSRVPQGIIKTSPPVTALNGCDARQRPPPIRAALPGPEHIPPSGHTLSLRNGMI
ncbi:hypothetical protein OF83DRAFT_464646 [Amylostereum chailletii]|nr:hypothetical protein OF83DRAFT_464646 [Amylostereum chailletii]